MTIDSRVGYVADELTLKAIAAAFPTERSSFFLYNRRFAPAQNFEGQAAL